MGLDISAYSHLKLTEPHEVDDDCFDELGHILAYAYSGFARSYEGLADANKDDGRFIGKVALVQFEFNLRHLLNATQNLESATATRAANGVIRIGDILQFTAVRRLGVALALPISSSYPLFTLIIAAVFLSEALTPRAIGGVLLVITG